MNDLSMKNRGELLRALETHKFEYTDDSRVFVPSMKLFAGGAYEIEHRRYEPSDKRRMLRKASRIPLVGKHVRNYRLRTQGGGDLISRELIANVMPTEALNHIWSVIVGGGTQVNPYYCGIFEGNVTPGATLTHATLVSVLTECVAYDETTRPAYVEGAVSGGAVDNSASRAVFTINASKTIYGAFLASSNVKSSTAAGTVLSAAKFTTSRAVVDDDELAVKVALAATSS